MAILKIIQAIIFVASTAYQISQQNKMKRAAEKRKGSVFQVRNEALSLPMIYGRQRAFGTQYDHRVSSDYFASPDEFGVQSFSHTLNNADNVDGDKNEFLFCYQVYGQGGVNGVKHVDVNGKAWNHQDYKHGLMIRSHNEGGVDPMMTLNGYPDTNVFSNFTSYAGMVFRLNRDENNYGGAPDVSFFVEGRKVRSITESFELSPSSAYSNNPAYVLLDYLMDDISGRGLPATAIDLQSFKRAADICDTIVLPGQEIAGHINGMLPISAYPSLANFPNPDDKGLSDTIFKADDTGLYYLWNKTGGSDEEPTGAYVLTTVPTRDIPLYECNLTIDTARTIRDNIESILGTMHYAELTWSEQGQYRLHLDYPSSQAALEALVDPSHHFTEDEILRRNFDISFPAATERFNQATVTFENEHEDFATDSVTWPETGSSVHLDYLSEDNQQPLRFEGSAEGITDPYHALARAEQIVRSSRTLMTVKFTVSRKALTVEPGDMIKVTLPQSGIDGDIFRVQEIKVLEDLSLEITAYFFDVNALAWNVSDDIPYKDRPIYNYGIPAPTNVVVTPGVNIGSDGTSFSRLAVTWDEILQANVEGYEVQWKLSAAPTYSNSATTRTTSYDILNPAAAAEYSVRVRGYSALGSYGPWSTDAVATPAPDTTPPADPTGLTAQGDLGSIELAWVNPIDLDFRDTEIWEGATATLGSAIKLTNAAGSTFNRINLAPLTTRYYWIRSVDHSGNTSNYVGPVSGSTRQVTAADIAPAVIPWDALDPSGDAVIAAAVDSLRSEVAGEYATITTTSLIENDINGLEGKYGVTVDLNGNISGFQLLSGVGGSAFNVRADQFAVFNSTGTAGDQPFTIFTAPRTVNGVTFPAGTYIKNAYIDYASFVEASIDTLQIKGEAVIVPTSTTDTINKAGGAADGAVQSVSLTLDAAGQVLVTWSGAQGYSGLSYHETKLLVNGGVVMSRGGDATNDMPNLAWSGSLSAGTHSIAIWWYGANSGVTLANGTLSVFGAKR